MDRMRELVNRLNETAYQYYVLNEPTISDKEWDALYDELIRLEKETGKTLPDSPTHRVGGETLAGFIQHRHLSRLWSMDKAQSIDALMDWANRAEKLRTNAENIEKNLPPLSYVVEYKYDGLTINLTYDGGQLVQAATRGNGVVGESILAQVKTIRSIPLSIPFMGRMEVHGEGYMRLSALDEYNKRAAEPLKNPRNGAAGALRNLDPAVTASRKLDASFYDVGYIEGKQFANHIEMVEFLREMRLPVSECEIPVKTMDEAIVAVHEIEQRRGELDFMIDGAVVKIYDVPTQQALGYTDKFPRWAVAYKFEAEEVTSTLMDVTWELGRTGKLTPLAHLAPVEVAGATVRRATLNNFGDITRKRVKIGAGVWIRRSNEVIPEIMGRVEEYAEGEREIEKPAACPACGTALVERGAHLFCPNREGCAPQIVGRLTHFASRDAMDIDTFSEKTAEQLRDALGVREPAQLYTLTAEELVELERFGEKKAAKLVEAIAKSCNCTLDSFIFAIGIPNVGRKTARDLAERYGSIQALMQANFQELQQLNDVGEIVASSICTFFQEDANRAMVETLLDAGIAPAWEARASGGVFDGISVVVTGTLEHMTRAEAENAIEQAGGTASASVSKKTAFLVAGSAAGSKLAKAEKLGIRVLDETEFIEMLKNRE